MYNQPFMSNINKLITLLLKSNHPVPITIICEELNLSRRSILYLIKKANHFLYQKQLTPIINIRGRGYQLSENSFIKLKTLIKKPTAKDIIINPHLYPLNIKLLAAEDRLIIINYLIITSPPMSINSLIKITNTSRNTILNELKLLDSYNLNNNFYIKTTSAGRIAIGNEFFLRKWILENFSKIIRILETFYTLNYEKKISATLINYEKFIKNILTEDSFNLISHFLFWYSKRLSMKKFLTTPSDNITQLPTPISLKWSKDFLYSYGIKQPNEILYLAHIISINPLSSIHLPSNSTYDNITYFANCLIKQFAQTSGYFNLLQDDELLNKLVSHLTSAYYRLKNNVHYHNPLLKKLKTDYKDLFYLTKSAVKSQEYILNACISDDEIGLIATYFGAAKKNTLPSAISKKVAVICSSGIGTSEFLLLQLKKRYPNVSFIGPLSADSYKNINHANISLILTTSKNFFAGDIPVLSISALPAKYEWLLIHNKLIDLDIIAQDETGEFDNINHIINIIENYARIENLSGLKAALKNYFNEKITSSSNESDAFDSLLKYINFLSTKCTWKEAINLSFAQLVKNNFVSKEYVKSILNLIEKHGDYMFIGNKFLLAHAKPDDGVYIKSAAITLFKHPFQLNSGKSVQCIISLAPADRSSHLTFLSLLLEKINNPNWCNKLFKISSQEALEKFLTN